MKQCTKDLVTGIVLMLLSVAYYVASKDIRVFSGAGATPISARTVPVIWAGLLFILSFCLVIRSVRRMQAVKKRGESLGTGRTVGNWLADNYAVVGTFIALCAYAACLRPVGYLISTFVYIIVQVILLTEKKKLNKRTFVITFVLSVCFTVVSDYLFVEMLSVPLPTGILGF